MWLIRTALRHPISVVVALLAIGLSSILALTRMPIDIFPKLNLPVIYVAQPYGGMDAAQMEAAPNSAQDKPSQKASSPPRIQASTACGPPMAARMRGIVMKGPIPIMSVMASAVA